MRLIPLMLVMVAAGCSHRSAAGHKETAPTSLMQAVLSPVGTIRMVNNSGRFVVVDFSKGAPVLEARLSIRRNGTKIGEIKVSGPQNGSEWVCDILSGEPQVDDDVRSE